VDVDRAETQRDAYKTNAKEVVDAAVKKSTQLSKQLAEERQRYQRDLQEERKRAAEALESEKRRARGYLGAKEALEKKVRRIFFRLLCSN
jgi:rubrerythrin